MATMRIKYLATSIMMQMHLQVFFPEKVFCDPDSDEAKQLKVLWLLHGEGGDSSDWMRLSRMEHFAQEHNLALIMPNMDNSMYMNMAHGAYPYFTYMTEELPPYIRSLLSILPEARERNYVAGVSTGGYGAVKWALNKPDFFGGCACLSGELDIRTAMREKAADGKLGDDWLAAFGSESYVTENENDLLFLARRLAKEGMDLPDIYLVNAVGDESAERNAQAVKLLADDGVRVRHVCENEEIGWKFWDKQLEEYIRTFN